MGGIGLSIRAPQPRFGLRGLAIIQDGIPITTADGTTEPGNVDLGSVGRIEVIRGPSSVLYGNSAGGVINLTTTFDTSRPLTITPDIQFGSYGYNRQQVRLDGGTAGTQFMASVSRFETDGFRQNSAAEISQANIVVRREVSANTEIRGVFNLYDAPFAESASFLNEADARADPVRDSDGECLSGACLARDRALNRHWGEGTTQGQGGMTVDNALVSFQNPLSQDFFSNAGKSSRDGVEVVLDWVPNPSFNTRVAYTYQDFVFEEFVSGSSDFGGNKEPGAPPHRVFVGFNYTAPFGLRSGASVRWVDEFFVRNDNTVSNWAYTVVDLRFGYDTKWGDVDVRPYVGIDNLFDKRYNSSAIVNAFGGRYYEPSPDREVYVGLTIGAGIR